MRQKELRLGAAIFLALFLAGLAPAGTAAGQDSGQVIEGDINKAAGDLVVPRDTTINGDITVNMGEVRIFGTVNGNVITNMGQVKALRRSGKCSREACNNFEKQEFTSHNRIITSRKGRI